MGNNGAMADEIPQRAHGGAGQVIAESLIRPSLDEFIEQANTRRVISIHARLLADDLTPVGLYEHLCGDRAGTFLFESDRAEIKPEYRPLVRRIADYLVAIGTTRVAVVGHADTRGAEDYNVALGMRRAKAVDDAIAEALPANVRGGLRVDINEDPAAPAGMNGQ